MNMFACICVGSKGLERRGSSKKSLRGLEMRGLPGNQNSPGKYTKKYTENLSFTEYIQTTHIKTLVSLEVSYYFVSCLSP